MSSLQGKVAIVTGAASGIGRATVQRFAAEGAAVTCADRDRDGVAAVADEIPTALVSVTEVSIADQVDTMVADTVAAFGGVDVLVAAAGIIMFDNFLELPEHRWDEIMNTNLKGVFLCGQATARQMVNQGRGGRIINISSVDSEIYMPLQPHYAASKGGVRMLTKAMAFELASYNITVNAIGPGLVDTNLAGGILNAPGGIQDVFKDRIPLGRFAEPEEIAGVAKFLAGDDASYLTGTTIFADGGYLIT